MKNTRYRASTITIRVTDLEKEIISRRAFRNGQSVSAYIIESAIEKDKRMTLEIIPLVKAIRKLTDTVRLFDKEMCDRKQRTAALDDLVVNQNKICEMMLHIAGN